MSGSVQPSVRVIHGDCLTVMRGMEADSVDAVVTDPPYGTGGRRRGKSGSGRDPSGKMVREEWDTWNIRWVFQARELLGDNGRIVAFCPAVQFGSMIAAAQQAGLPYMTHVAWRKLDPMPPYGGRLANAMEYALIFGRGALEAAGEHNVWEGSSEKIPVDSPDHHPYRKPAPLMRWLCRLVTPPGGTILDPFAGSGSTLVAAAMEGFNAIGIEQDEHYCEIARKRVFAAAQPRMDLDAVSGNAHPS